MSDLNSWEDDPAAQDDNLSRQTQQNLNLNNPQSNSFRPAVNSFQPGAQSFQPGQQFQQYGGYDQPQYNQYYNQQQGYGGYPQYNQHGYGQGGYAQQQQGSYGDGYNQQYSGYNQQQRNTSQPAQPQQRQVPVIAKRPSAADGTSAKENGASVPSPRPAEPVESSQAPKAKVLSIGGDMSAVGKDPAAKPKVLSLGTPAAPAGATAPGEAKKDTPKAEDGAKVAAAKAIEKTEKATPSSGAKSSPAPSSGTSSPSRAEPKATAREADVVAKEQTADVDEETLEEIYGKEHVNIIFIGHVDAGKSTLGGSILYATGMVDERTMDKYKREAKEAGTESWYLSWALDLTKEERSKGKTVEVGRGFFETEKRRYSILDAPGHKTFVPNMIGGASQADVGILVISARKGEYETGFEKGGQTREHAMLAKTQGVNKLIVVINKMDDMTVEWSKERYDECTAKLLVYLKNIGYNPKTGAP
ncbi:MAG: hypothetical protein M1812_006889 [Candelaria pacifica]|nr:MAG: hypothetical protein M1812_006889 [Candelaria pacifica]